MTRKGDMRSAREMHIAFLARVSRLDYPSAKSGEAVDNGAVSAVHLDR